MLGFENYASESLASKQLCRAFLLDSDALVLSGVLTRMAPNIEAVSKLTEAPHLAPVGWLCEPRKHSKSCRGLVRGGAGPLPRRSSTSCRTRIPGVFWFVADLGYGIRTLTAREQEFANAKGALRAQGSSEHLQSASWCYVCQESLSLLRIVRMQQPIVGNSSCRLSVVGTEPLKSQHQSTV